jgi:nicotinate phosphoribosyltransferase
MTQFDKRNLTMMMDLYEMTMANGYFSEETRADSVTFDVFYRKNPDNGGFAIFAGVEQIIEYIENLHFEEDDISYLRGLQLFDEKFLEYLKNYHFHGNISAFPEGTIMYPNEPILTVTAPLIDAQLIETAILAQINHQSLIATKTQRIVRAAKGRGVSDFGARRAHNMDAAIYGARAAYIGGAGGTATVLAGKMFDIPVSGTMAHSWVMYFDDEYTAFKKYAEKYPNAALLLVDTYDVLHSGVPNAIRVAKEVLEPMGKRLFGVRLDSGDLAYLSKKVRKMLDDAGLEDCKIVASNSLDEYTIDSIIDQGGRIDSFGVGERLITAKSDPVFGAVYKIAAVQKGDTVIPKIKISETTEKITNPGEKEVYRIYDENGSAIADLITKKGEKLDFSQPYRYVDPKKPWKNRMFENCTAKKLQIPMIVDGKRVVEPRSLEEIRNYVKDQLKNEIWDEEQRFQNPHIHYLDMSPYYYELKMGLLEESRKNND